MSYTNELRTLKKQRLYQHAFSSSVIDSLSSLMSDKAKRENELRNQALLNFYDFKIAQLEPLAQQEQKSQIISDVVNAVSSQESYISGTIEKSLEAALQSLNFR